MVRILYTLFLLNCANIQLISSFHFSSYVILLLAFEGSHLLGCRGAGRFLLGQESAFIVDDLIL